MAMSEQAARDIVDLVSSTDDHFDSEFDDEGASESESEEDEVRTACERLPEPARVAISRKRSFQRSGKESVAKRGRIAGGSSTLTRRGSVHHRVQQFPGEYLTVSSGKIYCSACSQTVQPKNSIVKSHISSQITRRPKSESHEPSYTSKR